MPQPRVWGLGGGVLGHAVWLVDAAGKGENGFECCVPLYRYTSCDAYPKIELRSSIPMNITHERRWLYICKRLSVSCGTAASHATSFQKMSEAKGNSAPGSKPKNVRVQGFGVFCHHNTWATSWTTRYQPSIPRNAPKFLTHTIPTQGRM